MKKLRISIKEFIIFYSISNFYKAKISVCRRNTNTTQNLISTQRQSVWENLYALFLSKMEENHMEETNVTMTAEEMQGEPAAKENETKAEKFIRIGEYRMNKAVDLLFLY